MTGCAPSRVKDIAHAIELVAPLRWQESYDNAGLQVGDPEAEVTGVLLCTDVTCEVIDEAIAHGFNLVVSHHPLIFHGLKKLVGSDEVQRMVKHEREEHGWEFLFLGANMDAIAAARSFGIREDRAVRYKGDRVGTALNYQVVSDAVGGFRCRKEISKDWRAPIEDDVKKRGE